MKNEYGEPTPRFKVGDVVNYWNRKGVIREWLGGHNEQYRVMYEWYDRHRTDIVPECELTEWSE